MSVLLLLVSLARAAAPPPPDVVPHRATEPHTLLHAHLHPLGFSPDGKLAVLTLPPDEAVGCFLWEVTVLDVVRDRPVATLRWDDGGCDTVVDLPTLWAARGGEIEALLTRHGVQRAAVPLTPLPLARGGDTLAVSLVTAPGQRDPTDESVTVPLRVVARWASRGEKDVGEAEAVVRFDLPQTWGHEVLGLLISPHEPRAVVVVRELRRGWEGPPSIEGFHLYGVHLERGYTAP